MGKKNYDKSVKTRLLNLMNETGYKYMYLLARYFNERLLYRVSVSQYKDKFLLKGGSLLYAMKLANFLNIPVDQLFEYQGVDHALK